MLENKSVSDKGKQVKPSIAFYYKHMGHPKQSLRAENVAPK